jgi:hypothetical protein
MVDMYCVCGNRLYTTYTAYTYPRTNMEVALSKASGGETADRCGCKQRAATSHGAYVGVRRWVGSTGPRGGAASRASTVRNGLSCWAPQLLLALAVLLPTCGAGEESNGTNFPKCTIC